jgi:hypothetical protein
MCKERWKESDSLSVMDEAAMLLGYGCAGYLFGKFVVGPIFIYCLASQVISQIGL